MISQNYMNDRLASHLMREAEEFRTLACGIRVVSTVCVLVRAERSALALVDVHGRNVVWDGNIYSVTFDSHEHAKAVQTRLIKSDPRHSSTIRPLRDYLIGQARYLEEEVRQLMNSPAIDPPSQSVEGEV